LKKREPPKNSIESIRNRPARTPEARENRLIALAYDLVEQRLIEGTATSQETTHFLRLGSQKERIEREILEKQKELITAKTEALKSAKRVEELYSDAIAAFRSYSGQPEESDDQDIY
jgi:hypothetical protein